MWWSALAGLKSGLNHPLAGLPGRGCLMSRPETPYDPGNITDDVSGLHREVYLKVHYEVLRGFCLIS